MEIKGLTGYDVFYDEGIVKVYSKVKRMWLKPQNDIQKRYMLKVEGKTKPCSFGFIRFLMLHPEIDARYISPRELRIKFADDGSVLDLYSNKRERKYSCFEDVDDALSTVLMMKAAQSGDLSFIHKFMAEKRKNAIWCAAKLEGVPRREVEECIDDGEERFIREITTANCEKIMPIYAWFCKCLRKEVLEKRKRQRKLNETTVSMAVSETFLL